MEPPPVQYATTRDGKQIAYGVSGSGPPLVLGPIPWSHVQLVWAEHNASSLMSDLASRFRVHHYDPRGSGMSDRGLGPDHKLEDWLLDIEAVVRAERLQRFVLFAAGFGGAIAGAYALHHPDQVTALILAGVNATPDPHLNSVYLGAAARDWALYLSLFEDQTKPREYRQRQVENLKQISWPEDTDALHRVSSAANYEDVLRKLTVPTMVMAARNFRLQSVPEATVAAQLSRGRLYVLEGASSYGEPGQAGRAIDSFLAELNEPLPQLAIPQDDVLSAREVEVMRLIAAGKSNQQIAEELVISINTVGRHVSNIFTKANVANRTEAAAYGRAKGLV